MKYKFTGETKAELGVTLRRIRAKISIAVAGVAKGDLGGWIEGERNLSQSGNAWVFGDARVFGDAWVSGDAQVSGNAWVFGNARVFGNAQVFGDAWVSGNAQVFGNARVSSPIASATRSDGYQFTIFPLADKSLRITAGCRFFTINEAREHWHRTRGGTQLGSESLLIVDYLERVAEVRGWKQRPDIAQAAE